MANHLQKPTQSEILIYQTEDRRTRLEVCLQGETVWMTQAAMAGLYQTTPQNITLHLKAVCQEGELDPQATCKEFLHVQIEQIQRGSFMADVKTLVNTARFAEIENLPVEKQWKR
ncbi:MAG: hypothetical protein R6U13_10760 [Desulfatiglandaceae bacterium]